MDVDFYVCIGYKLYGFMGIGILYGKKDCFEVLWLFCGGGEMIEEVSKDCVIYFGVFYWFEVGMLFIVEVIGFGVVFIFMMLLDVDVVWLYEYVLLVYVMESLCELNLI